MMEFVKVPDAKRWREALKAMEPLMDQLDIPHNYRKVAPMPFITFGANTTQGSLHRDPATGERKLILQRTRDPKFAELLGAAHAAARAGFDEVPPYAAITLVRLDEGQRVPEHRDTRNHADHPNHCVSFGRYEGGRLEALVDDEWRPANRPEDSWLKFRADLVKHRVEPVTSGRRYSMILHTPFRLDLFSEWHWEELERLGFPVEKLSKPK